MDWLKEILGEELYNKVVEKVNLHNGDENNKNKQVKIANLSSGEYVGKGKFESLETEHNSKLAELEAANKMIAEFKKGSKGNEELQSKIANYEQQVVELQKQLATAKLESAVKVALLEAKATDIDYMTFKLKEKGELTLDDKGHVSGIDDMIQGLKTQFPNQFEGSSQKKIIENKLPNSNENATPTRNDILKMPYNKRVELYEKNPEAYKNAMNNNN